MKITIIGGGGRVGACAAFALQCAGVVSQIQILDANQDMAEGEALDLLHGSALTADHGAARTGSVVTQPQVVVDAAQTSFARPARARGKAASRPSIGWRLARGRFSHAAGSTPSLPVHLAESEPRGWAPCWRPVAPGNQTDLRGLLQRYSLIRHNLQICAP